MVGILDALVRQLEHPTIDRAQLNQALVLITTLVHVYGAASLIVTGGSEAGATRASRMDVERAVSVWRRLVVLQTSSPYEVPLDMFRITEAMHVRYEQRAQEQRPLRGTAAQRRLSRKFPGSKLAEFAQSLVDQNSRLAPSARDRGLRSSSFLAKQCMLGLFALHSADASFNIVQHASTLPAVDLDTSGTRVEFGEYVRLAFREHEQARTPKHAPTVDLSLWVNATRQCADLEAKIMAEQGCIGELISSSQPSTVSRAQRHNFPVACARALRHNGRNTRGRDHTSTTTPPRASLKRRRIERVPESNHLGGVMYDNESSCDETADASMDCFQLTGPCPRSQ